jgi:hypothetical protein
MRRNSTIPRGAGVTLTRRLALGLALGSGAVAMPHAAAAEAPRVSIVEHRVAEHALPRLDATITIAAPVEQVWALVSDCLRAREFMELEKVDVVARHGKVVRCSTLVDVPFPFGKLRGVTDATDESRPGLYRQSWRLVSGDYLYDEGYWELSSPQPGKTLVRYVTLTEPKLPVPSGMLASGQRDYVEKMLLRLNERLSPRPPARR